MSTFEPVVRPFAAPQVSYPQRYVTPNQRSTPPIRLQLGRSGSGKTMGGNTSLNVSFYCDQQVVEKSKKSR